MVQLSYEVRLESQNYIFLTDYRTWKLVLSLPTCELLLSLPRILISNFPETSTSIHRKSLAILGKKNKLVEREKSIADLWVLRIFFKEYVIKNKVI